MPLLLAPLLLASLLLAGALPAHAAEAPPAPPPAGDSGESEEDPLSPYRTPFGVLLERSIGSTSTPVAFDWRRTRFQLGATGDFLFELNNFNSMGAGILARFPSRGLLYEVGVSRVWVWDTPSSELLALTPYRQPGRPKRFELELTLGVPLAEGVVTARPRFVPVVQMLLSGYAGLRYAFYPMSFEGMKAREVGAALLSPALTGTEVENLDERRLDAMQVDTGRYSLVLGLGDELYFKQGIFFSPRVLVSLPVLAPASGTELLFSGEISLVAGVAF